MSLDVFSVLISIKLLSLKKILKSLNTIKVFKMATVPYFKNVKFLTNWIKDCIKQTISSLNNIFLNYNSNCFK